MQRTQAEIRMAGKAARASLITLGEARQNKRMEQAHGGGTGREFSLVRAFSASRIGA